MARRDECRQTWLVSVLAVLGLMVLLAPVTASAPCASAPEGAMDSSTGAIELAPTPCRASQMTIGGPVAQGRMGPWTATSCPGNCGECGCGGITP